MKKNLTYYFENDEKIIGIHNMISGDVRGISDRTNCIYIKYLIKE